MDFKGSEYEVADCNAHRERSWHVLVLSLGRPLVCFYDASCISTIDLGNDPNCCLPHNSEKAKVIVQALSWTNAAECLVLGHGPDRQSHSGELEPCDEEEGTRFEEEEHCCQARKKGNVRLGVSMDDGGSRLCERGGIDASSGYA